MVHMQDCDLVVVLAQDEEEGVHELNELGEVVPPEHADDLGGRGRQHLPGSALNPRIPPPPLPPTGPAKASLCSAFSQNTRGWVGGWGE